MAQAAKPTNGYDADKLKSYITRVENLDQEIASKTGEFMKAIKLLKDDKKEVIQEAKNEGFPPKPLKALIQCRKLQRNIEKIEDGLEGDDADSLAAIRESLGDWAEDVSARAA